MYVAEMEGDSLEEAWERERGKEYRRKEVNAPECLNLTRSTKLCVGA